MLRPYIKLLISEMKLSVLTIDVLLAIKSSITYCRRLILHYILGILSFFTASILKTIQNGGSRKFHPWEPDSVLLFSFFVCFSSSEKQLDQRSLMLFEGVVPVFLRKPKKKVSMIRKYHNHTPQTNPRHREEESQDIYSNKTSVRQ